MDMHYLLINLREYVLRTGHLVGVLVHNWNQKGFSLKRVKLEVSVIRMRRLYSLCLKRAFMFRQVSIFNYVINFRLKRDKRQHLQPPLFLAHRNNLEEAQVARDRFFLIQAAVGRESSEYCNQNILAPIQHIYLYFTPYKLIFKNNSSKHCPISL